MVEVITLLLGISLILFFGFIAEFLFKQLNIPDVLFLIILGFVMGPHALGYIHPSDLAGIAPFFTTFALLFLLFDGAFNINLSSFAKGVVSSFKITLFNIIVSAVVVSALMFVFGFNLLTSLLTGFILSGVSSAFTIPVLKGINKKGEAYSILTLESAMTDVFTIVFALTTLAVIQLNTFSFQAVVTQIASLFAIAGFLGIISGIIWIVLVNRIFRHNKSYMMTIAYLLLVYVVTEYLGGNGAIAALFFGFILKNSKKLTLLFKQVTIRNIREKQEMVAGATDEGIAATTHEEEFFYSQISFFLKTFFFVYVGLLLDMASTSTILIGLVISIAVMFSRCLCGFLLKGLGSEDKKLVKSLFARGLAAAAVVQVVSLNGIANSDAIGKITYSVITFTIILSSAQIFIFQKKSSQNAQQVKGNNKGKTIKKQKNPSH